MKLGRIHKSGQNSRDEANFNIYSHRKVGIFALRQINMSIDFPLVDFFLNFSNVFCLVEFQF